MINKIDEIDEIDVEDDDGPVECAETREDVIAELRRDWSRALTDFELKREEGWPSKRLEEKIEIVEAFLQDLARIERAE